MIDRRQFIALSCLFACDPLPPVLTLSVVASADQNPSPTGTATAVAVRLFQLGSTAKFERADVFALTEREQQTLGTDDLGSEEFVVRPGEIRVITRDLKPGAQYIGIAVLFRDIDKARWRGMAPVAANGPSRHTLTVKALSATLA
jgi:type VI secretion system protein VasD